MRSNKIRRLTDQWPRSIPRKGTLPSNLERPLHDQRLASFFPNRMPCSGSAPKLTAAQTPVTAIHAPRCPILNTDRSQTKIRIPPIVLMSFLPVTATGRGSPRDLTASPRICGSDEKSSSPHASNRHGTPTATHDATGFARRFNPGGSTTCPEQQTQHE
jgi:hypothetical protein